MVVGCSFSKIQTSMVTICDFSDTSETRSLFLVDDNSLTLSKEFLPVMMVFIEGCVWPYDVCTSFWL
jgi:hypothetical protein